MKIYLILYLVSLPITFIMFFNHSYKHNSIFSDKRKSIGKAIIFSLIIGILGPLGMFVAFALTDCCRYGISLRYLFGKEIEYEYQKKKKRNI